MLNTGSSFQRRFASDCFGFIILGLKLLHMCEYKLLLGKIELKHLEGLLEHENGFRLLIFLDCRVIKELL
jgi:hypothetical protein